jgi:hypothetical protein
MDCGQTAQWGWEGKLVVALAGFRQGLRVTVTVRIVNSALMPGLAVVVCFADHGVFDFGLVWSVSARRMWPRDPGERMMDQ